MANSSPPKTGNQDVFIGSSFTGEDCLFQYPITHQVTMFIIDIFEMIQIHDGQIDRLMCCRVLVQ